MTVGIPTTHAYSNFRSRLEARWSAFFDLIGWGWIYEPLDADGYIPDFLITGRRPMYVEIGPCLQLAEYEAKNDKPNRNVELLKYDVLILGMTPLPQLDPVWTGYSFAGLLGERFEEPDVDSDYVPVVGTEHAEFSWGAAIWANGGGGLEVYHQWQDYGHRPHGVGREEPIHDGSGIERLWREAGNAVQWRGR